MMMIVYEDTPIIIVETISKDYLNGKGTILAKCYSFKMNILKEYSKRKWNILAERYTFGSKQWKKDF